MTHKEALIAAIDLRKNALQMDIDGHARFTAMETQTQATETIISTLAAGIESGRNVLEALEKRYEEQYGPLVTQSGDNQ